MDLAPSLPVLLQDFCLGLGPSPPSTVTPALTVGENPGMHRLMFPVLVMGWEGSPAAPTVELVSYSQDQLASLEL